MTDHFREAERLIKQADTWENADQGWRAGMSGKERIDRRQADYLGAIAHAVTGVLEALQAEPPLRSVQVPVLDVPMLDDRDRPWPAHSCTPGVPGTRESCAGCERDDRARKEATT